MKRPSFRDGLARIAVSLGALLPYLPALSFNRIYVTDDVFTSDIYNGELPVRVLVGKLLAAGQAPVWSSKMCSGVPLAANAVFEPISLGLFTRLNTGPALCLLVILIALIAAHGAYTLAQRLGADRLGAILAGIAFAGSGYVVTQLKHLGIVMTVVWFPWGLFLLDRALATAAPARIDGDWTAARSPSVAGRLRDIGLFGAVLGEQIAAGFPQSALYCGLVYGCWSLVLLVKLRGKVGRLPLPYLLSVMLLLAVVLAATCGAPMLLPLGELGSYSDRRGQMSWEFATMAPYAWRDLLNFVVPYANGDIANATYHVEGIFWENYGYVGAATLVLALWTVVRSPRRPRVLLLFCVAIVAMSLVLGPHTPVYHFVWKYVPGMGHFRFPTRLLFVVELALAILGALGLGLLRQDLARLFARVGPRVPTLLCIAVTSGTALDLFANQSHQNPFVPAAEWLAPPPTVSQLVPAATSSRIYTPLHRDLHMMAFGMAHGWTNLEPYRFLRNTLAPNAGLYWDIPSADCYVGLSPAWFVDVWGDHSRAGVLLSMQMRLGQHSIQTSPGFGSLLATYGVTHVLSPVPLSDPQLTEVPGGQGIHVYKVPGRRARILANAQMVSSNQEAASILVRPDFDPTRSVLLHRKKGDQASDVVAELAEPRAQATIVAEDSRHLRIDVVAPQGGYLLLADTYYPGWHARVDGVDTPIYRADISSRAVRLPKGARRVDFQYDATLFFKGLRLAAAGVVMLLLWLIAAFRTTHQQARLARSIRALVANRELRLRCP